MASSPVDRLLRGSVGFQQPSILAPPGTNRKRPNLVGPQGIVKVIVHDGSDGVVNHSPSETQTFSVHKDHICHYSPFFDAALNGNFAESRNQAVELYEEKPETFGMFVNWLYTQEVVSADDSPPTIASLVHLWLLADRILVPSLQNQAIDLLENTRQQKGNDRLPSNIFPLVYNKTTAESPLRLYIIEVCSALYLAHIRNTKNYPVQMLVDIINSIRSRATGKDRLASVAMAPYHVQVEEGEDERAKRRRTQ